MVGAVWLTDSAGSEFAFSRFGALFLGSTVSARAASQPQPLAFAQLARRGCLGFTMASARFKCLAQAQMSGRRLFLLHWCARPTPKTSNPFISSQLEPALRMNPTSCEDPSYVNEMGADTTTIGM